MTDFLLRDLDADLMDRLRERADANGRSIQSEIHSILRSAIRLSKQESVELLKRLQAEATPSPDSTRLLRESRDA